MDAEVLAFIYVFTELVDVSFLSYDNISSARYFSTKEFDATVFCSGGSKVFSRSGGLFVSHLETINKVNRISKQ